MTCSLIIRILKMIGDSGNPMLMAVSRGKAGRLTIPGTDSSMSWRSLFRGNEDLLTGTLFGRMRFLSPSALQKVMAMLVGPDHASALGDLVSLECWPRMKGLTGRHWVEPDVLMKFSAGYVLVELKPPFGGKQSEDQWRTEVCATVADPELWEVGRPAVLHFLALGRTGRPDGEIELVFEDIPDGVEIFVHCREWQPFLDAMPRLVERSKGGDAAVFEDWLEAFSLFGLLSRLPLEWAGAVTWVQRLDRPLELDSLWKEADLHIPPDAHSGRSHKNQLDWHELACYSQHKTLELQRWE